MQGSRAFKGKHCFEAGTDRQKLVISKPGNSTVLIRYKSSRILIKLSSWSREMLYYLWDGAW